MDIDDNDYIYKEINNINCIPSPVESSDNENKVEDKKIYDAKFEIEQRIKLSLQELNHYCFEERFNIGTMEAIHEAKELLNQIEER